MSHSGSELELELQCYSATATTAYKPNQQPAVRRKLTVWLVKNDVLKDIELKYEWKTFYTKYQNTFPAKLRNDSYGM